MARTAEPVSSHARIGTPFKAELEQDVVVKGNVVLRAGTPVIGVVETSLGTRPSSSALTRELENNLDKRTKRSGSNNRRVQARPVQDEERRFRLRSRVELPLPDAHRLSARPADQLVIGHRPGWLALRTAALFRCRNRDGIDHARCVSMIRVNGKSPQNVGANEAKSQSPGS